MTREETHNDVVAVLFSDDVRSESGRAFGRRVSRSHSGLRASFMLTPALPPV